MNSNILVSKIEDKKNLIVFDNNKITPFKEEFEKMDEEIYQVILENI